MSVSIEPFFHEDTSTASYVVVDRSGKHAIIIDSVLDFDLFSGEVSSELADRQLAFLKDNDLHLDWVLDTHAHADHLSAADYLKSKTSAQTVMGEGIVSVQNRFAQRFNKQSLTNKSFDDVDVLLADGDTLTFGDSTIEVLATPGHTDDSVSFLIEGNIFVGDTLFMPDGGTARCDFPGGSASILWSSIEKIHALPDNTKIWVCHDYQPGGRDVKVWTTVKQSRETNIHTRSSIEKEAFIKMREARDATLAVPKLLYPSLQVNLWGGRLPEPAKNGIRYLSIPLTDKLQRENS